MLWIDSTGSIPVAVALIRHTTEDQIYDWLAAEYVTLPKVFVFKQHHVLATPFGPGTPCNGAFRLSLPSQAYEDDVAVNVWSSDFNGVLNQRLALVALGAERDIVVRISGR
jgi:hypothetical protein